MLNSTVDVGETNKRENALNVRCFLGLSLNSMGELSIEVCRGGFVLAG